MYVALEKRIGTEGGECAFAREASFIGLLGEFMSSRAFKNGLRVVGFASERAL